MRVDWCVSSWFRIKNTHSLTHAVYATATACGIALVQLGDAGPSAGLQCERTLCVAARAGGSARPHTGCGGSYAPGSAASH